MPSWHKRRRFNVSVKINKKSAISVNTPQYNNAVVVSAGGLYDRGKDLNWKNLKDMGYLAAMGRAGGGRNETDPRFISLFSVFNMTFPSEESLFLIYSSILKGHLQPFEKVLQGKHPVSVHNIYNGTIEYVIFFCL